MLFSGGTVVQRIQAFQFCMGFPGKGELPYYKMVIYYVGLRNFNFYSFYYDNIYILRCMYSSKMLNHKRHIHGC